VVSGARLAQALLSQSPPPKESFLNRFEVFLQKARLQAKQKFFFRAAHSDAFAL
jgi:hypothetical protein